VKSTQKTDFSIKSESVIKLTASRLKSTLVDLSRLAVDNSPSQSITAEPTDSGDYS